MSAHDGSIAMLNRFQFARLRAFRRGNKAADETKASGQRSSKGSLQDPPKGAGQSPGEASRDPRATDQRAGPDRRGNAPAGATDVHDSWQDDDRVARLLARRAAAQEEERRLALERLGGVSGPASEATTSVDFTTKVPAERKPDARTTTVPPLEGTHPLAPSGPDTTDQDASPEAVFGQREGSSTAHASSWRRDGGRGATSARVICIASGKGGTGKSVMATNLAILRARRGERVLLVDFDAGLVNAHLLLGLAPPYDLGHVMEGEVTAREALVEGPHGVRLLSGGVGRQTMIDPTRRELDRLFKALRPLEAEFDLIIIDHGAGLSYSTVAHLSLIHISEPTRPY